MFQKKIIEPVTGGSQNGLIQSAAIFQRLRQHADNRIRVLLRDIPMHKLDTFQIAFGRVWRV